MTSKLMEGQKSLACTVEIRKKLVSKTYRKLDKGTVGPNLWEPVGDFFMAR
jgi:hypothetical protein